MAINLEIIQSRGTVREAGRNAQAFTLPAAGVLRMAAAGNSAPLKVTAELFLVRNKGDAVWFNVGLIANNGSVDADGVSYAPADNIHSIRLETGDEFPFGLNAEADASLYNVRIAAA